MSWPTSTLGELSKSVDYGLSLSASAQPVGPKFLRITDIQNGTVDWNEVPYCQAAPALAASNRLLPGDIVFARTGATTGKSFLIKECPEDSVFASYLIRVRPRPSLEPAFLAHFFQSEGYWTQIQSVSRGAAQPGVNSTVLKNLKVPLPPLDEQRRIAAILDQADDLRRKRREVLHCLKKLKASLFRTTFGDPIAPPLGWPKTTISKLTTSSQYGTSAKAGAEGKLPILRMGNITYDGDWLLDSMKYIDLKTKDIEKYTTIYGDILFNRTNSPELVGKTAVFRENISHAFAGYLIRLRTNELCTAEYISAYLNSPYGKSILKVMCKSIVGMANINAKELGNIEIPAPPLETQKLFADYLNEIRINESCQKSNLARLDALFASLQHRAFRGEL